MGGGLERHSVAGAGLHRRHRVLIWVMIDVRGKFSAQGKMTQVVFSILLYHTGDLG